MTSPSRRRSPTTRPAPARPRRRPGRPATPINLDHVKKLASRFCTDQELANFLGITRETFNRRKNRDPQIRNAVELGRAKAEIAIRKAQFALAEKGDPHMLV